MDAQAPLRIEVLVAVLAEVFVFMTMRALMVNHVTQLGRLDVTERALKKLICAACLIIDHILLLEAHVACVSAVSVAYALFDYFMVG